MISEECSHLFPKPRLDYDVTPKHLKAVFKMQIKAVVACLPNFLCYKGSVCVTCIVSVLDTSLPVEVKHRTEYPQLNASIKVTGVIGFF